MKKVLALIVTVALVASMFASLSISAANDPIVLDFSKDGNVTPLGDGDDANWNITLPGDVHFMGKYAKTRIGYEYDAAAGAAHFTAHNGDAYFVSSDAAGNDAALPASHQIDTSVYKYMKISYKKDDHVSNNVSQGYFFFLPAGASYGDYATQTVIFTYGTTGEWAEEIYDLTTLEPFGEATDSNWANVGTVTKLRFNFFSSNNMAQDGDELWIKYVAFFATQEEAEAFTNEPAKEPEQPGTEEPGTDAPVVDIVDWADYGNGKSLSWDSLSVNEAGAFIDGIADGAPNLVKWMSEHDNTVDGSDSSISKLYVKGWVGLDQKVVKIGYSVDGGAPVFVTEEGTLDYEVSDPIKAAGGDNAVKYNMPIDVSQISGKHEITVVVELEDGTVVALTIAAQPMVFTYQGPGQKDPQPEIPATSDATGAVFMIAAAAVVVTVLLKKKVMG